MEILQDNWLNVFLQELKGTNEIKIVSPFVTDNMVSHLLNNWKGNTIKLITRFNLNDFRSGVSSLSALKRLLAQGAEIKGIKDLHSKTYIFDVKSVIITSANFTGGGFFRNHELGVISHNPKKTLESIEYFSKLWKLDNFILSGPKIDEWNINILNNRVIINSGSELEDYGTCIINKVVKQKNYFIKFYGTNYERAERDVEIIEEVSGTHCHFAVTFSKSNGRPRRYQDGDIIYLARMVSGGDYAIFGRAIARRHIDDRDIASPEDIARVPWKDYYPVYIRIHSTKFLSTNLGNCPMMGDLIKDLDYECFRSTKKRYLDGEQNINPKNVLMQKPDVILSEEGAYWVEQKFKEAEKTYSLISQLNIDNLYQGIPQIL
ncbi:phospholipase D family protein [Flavobacterium sp. CLA17]|uniref:phospholipase D family protein n=1 Tax=Flavobacterium sp. CLA17 TaxID=2724135 RepID=UPI00149187C7|nr:phospholipase D family protein [Flavobacterium sp. CLA17]QSB29084.1 phospholipase D family protein [Flavobacterium sp. CLA17]